MTGEQRSRPASGAKRPSPTWPCPSGGPRRLFAVILVVSLFLGVSAHGRTISFVPFLGWRLGWGDEFGLRLGMTTSDAPDASFSPVWLEFIYGAQRSASGFEAMATFGSLTTTIRYGMMEANAVARLIGPVGAGIGVWWPHGEIDQHGFDWLGSHTITGEGDGEPEGVGFNAFVAAEKWRATGWFASLRLGVMLGEVHFNYRLVMKLCETGGACESETTRDRFAMDNPWFYLALNGGYGFGW